MLSEILEYKKKEIRHRETSCPLAILKAQISRSRQVRDFASALKCGTISLIAEVKKRSPSRGLLLEAHTHLELAIAYQRAGVNAISVLGDEHFFAGSPGIVREIAQDSRITVPILFKDFIISEYQIYEARACNADAVLLIVRALDQISLSKFIGIATSLGMSALVEAFDDNDIERALSAGASIIGINNRDLVTFKTDFSRTRTLIERIPQKIIKVSESGIACHDDVMEMERMGFDAMLVGEAIITHANIQARVKELMGR